MFSSQLLSSKSNKSRVQHQHQIQTFHNAYQKAMLVKKIVIKLIDKKHLSAAQKNDLKKMIKQIQKATSELTPQQINTWISQQALVQINPNLLEAKQIINRNLSEYKTLQQKFTYLASIRQLQDTSRFYVQQFQKKMIQLPHKKQIYRQLLNRMFYLEDKGKTFKQRQQYMQIKRFIKSSNQMQHINLPQLLIKIREDDVNPQKYNPQKYIQQPQNLMVEQEIPNIQSINVKLLHNQSRKLTRIQGYGQKLFNKQQQFTKINSPQQQQARQKYMKVLEQFNKTKQIQKMKQTENKLKQNNKQNNKKQSQKQKQSQTQPKKVKKQVLMQTFTQLNKDIKIFLGIQGRKPKSFTQLIFGSQSDKLNGKSNKELIDQEFIDIQKLSKQFVQQKKTKKTAKQEQKSYFQNIKIISNLISAAKTQYDRVLFVCQHFSDPGALWNAAVQMYKQVMTILWAWIQNYIAKYTKSMVNYAQQGIYGLGKKQYMSMLLQYQGVAGIVSVFIGKASMVLLLGQPMTIFSFFANTILQIINFLTGTNIVTSILQNDKLNMTVSSKSAILQFFNNFNPWTVLTDIMGAIMKSKIGFVTGNMFVPVLIALYSKSQWTSKILVKLKNGLNDGLKYVNDKIKSAYKSMKNKVKTISNNFHEYFQNQIKFLKAKLQQLKQWLVNSALYSHFQHFLTKIAGAVKQASGNISKAYMKIMAAVNYIATPGAIYQRVMASLQWYSIKISTAVQSVWNSITYYFQNFSSQTKKIISQTFFNKSMDQKQEQQVNQFKKNKKKSKLIRQNKPQLEQLNVITQSIFKQQQVQNVLQNHVSINMIGDKLEQNIKPLQKDFILQINQKNQYFKKFKNTMERKASSTISKNKYSESYSFPILTTFVHQDIQQQLVLKFISFKKMDIKSFINQYQKNQNFRQQADAYVNQKTQQVNQLKALFQLYNKGELDQTQLNANLDQFTNPKFDFLSCIIALKQKNGGQLSTHNQLQDFAYSAQKIKTNLIKAHKIIKLAKTSLTTQQQLQIETSLIQVQVLLKMFKKQNLPTNHLENIQRQLNQKFNQQSQYFKLFNQQKIQARIAKSKVQQISQSGFQLKQQQQNLVQKLNTKIRQLQENLIQIQKQNSKFKQENQKYITKKSKQQNYQKKIIKYQLQSQKQLQKINELNQTIDKTQNSKQQLRKLLKQKNLKQSQLNKQYQKKFQQQVIQKHINQMQTVAYNTMQPIINRKLESLKKQKYTKQIIKRQNTMSIANMNQILLYIRDSRDLTNPKQIQQATTFVTLFAFMLKLQESTQLSNDLKQHISGIVFQFLCCRANLTVQEGMKMIKQSKTKKQFKKKVIKSDGKNCMQKYQNSQNKIQSKIISDLFKFTKL